MATDPASLPSAIRILARDELIGFARSKVMLVLWVILPALSILGYLAFGARLSAGSLSASDFMGILVASIAGAVAALMIAVDLINERNRNVYVLLAIRPIRRDSIIWAKFLAVFGCVAIACAVSLALGVVIDLIRGVMPTGDSLIGLGKSLLTTWVSVALATAAGALFGVAMRSVLGAVILVLYLGQNIAAVPMLPVYLHLLPNKFWLVMVISLALFAAVMAATLRTFRKAQL